MPKQLGTSLILDEEAAWAEGLAREWAADWNDPREDIYTLDDGEAIAAHQGDDDDA